LDPGFRSPLGEISERPSFETFLAKPVTLTDHLLWQLSLSHASDNVAEAAECVIGNLNEDGYLTAQLDEMARVAGISIEDIETGLALVQEFDPLGVAARDVAECLLIQLRAADADTGVAGEIVTQFQQQLQDGNLAEIAARMGRPLRHIETAVALIRNLDPRPGQRYNSSSARAVEPDVQFVKTPNGFEVALNEDDLPDLRLNRQYRRLLEKGNSSKEVRNYVKERYHSAIQLLRNIEQRRQTIRNVCEAIVQRQTAFLAHGLEHLRPMMIKDVAEEIGVHPSTVSRAVANKYAYTPHGVYELRFFFSEAVQGPAGASVPLLLLKRKVKKMIGEENPAHPLTDDHISKMLREDGIQVTRRTVAKYREDLQIPSTHRRRRRS
jgi:RNA polymerase sigma-54 factor